MYALNIFPSQQDPQQDALWQDALLQDPSQQDPSSTSDSVLLLVVVLEFQSAVF